MTKDFSGAGNTALTDRDIGAVLCTTCGTLTDAAGEQDVVCPVCNSHVSQRKKDSIRRTWALTITAALLYIPANLLPVMDLQILGTTTSNNILQGVVQFYQNGMYFICAVVFVASFVVPVFKIGTLFYLLITLSSRNSLTGRRRTTLYHIIEFVGKWSMLDVYVVAVMSGLIDSGNMLSIRGGWGIVFFCAVVLLTMKASASFDTRIIWDRERDYA